VSSGTGGMPAPTSVPTSILSPFLVQIACSSYARLRLMARWQVAIPGIALPDESEQCAGSK